MPCSGNVWVDDSACNNGTVVNVAVSYKDYTAGYTPSTSHCLNRCRSGTWEIVVKSPADEAEVVRLEHVEGTPGETDAEGKCMPMEPTCEGAGAYVPNGETPA